MSRYLDRGGPNLALSPRTQFDLRHARGGRHSPCQALAVCLAVGLFGARLRTAPGPDRAAESSPVRIASGSQPFVTYELDLSEPASHLVGVTMTIPEALPETEIQFPTWNALYQIRDFVRDVQQLRAQCGGDPIELTMVDLDTWRSGPRPCSPLLVRYAVYANSDPPFSSSLNDEHAFFNPATLLFYLPRERARTVRVKFVLPPGWKLATLLEPADAPAQYRAANYDDLADSPIEAGAFEEYSYVQSGATYRVIVHARGSDYSPDRLMSSLKKITATETALMRDVPFSRYTFIFHFTPGGGGAMEHRNGAAISVSPERLRTRLEGVESLAAHEFFHLWNVKRIRPQGLEPVDYVHGNDTSDLWFSEGVTSTYGELALLRAGLVARRDFYAHVADEIHDLEERPARKFQSVIRAGREAWLEKYADYSRPERSISYYNKGELLGYLLDLAIRRATQNRRGLDEVMRSLNENFARRSRFFTDADLEETIRDLAPEFAGLDAFFRDYVAGTADLDYQTYLGYAGLRLSTESVERPALGFLALRSFGGAAIRIESVEPGSSAEKVGLARGDVLMELNGHPLRRLPAEQLAGMKPGKEIKVQVRRGSQILNLKFALGRTTGTMYRLKEAPGATPEQLAVREGWLDGRTAR